MKVIHKMFTEVCPLTHSDSDSCYTPPIDIKQRKGAWIRARHAERDSRSTSPGLQQATEWSRSRP